MPWQKLREKLVEQTIQGVGFSEDIRKIAKASKTEFVKSIDSVVKKVYLDEQGFISSVDLENGQTIYADFFIDASGFSKVLMDELDNKWESYSKYLPVNCAIIFGSDFRSLQP